MKFSSLLRLCVIPLLSVKAIEIPNDFQNINIAQRIDLTGSYVKRLFDVTAKNIAKEPKSDYFIAVNANQHDNLAIIEGQDKSTGRSVFTQKVEELSNDELVYYKLTLREPIEPGKEFNLLISEAFTDILQPLPEYGDQKDSQYLLYSGIRYPISPYKTDKGSLNVKLHGTFAEELSDEPLKPGKVENNILSYGDFKNIKPLTIKPFKLRYINPRPMIKADKLDRDIWVSHWGASVSIEETYWLSNIGTKLKDKFSRIDYTKGQNDYNLNIASIRELHFKLAPNARDGYFTDLVGNVSTSKFHSNNKETNFDIRPRYPVFGGWHYNFTIGWSHNIADFVKAISPDKYILKVPIIQGPQDISYGEVNVRIILPEGAKNIQIVSLFGGDSKISNTFSFLDTVGRPTIELYYNNLLDGHRNGDLYVEYTYTKFETLRKPLTIAATLTSFFTIFLIFSKIDISIFRK